MSRVKTYADKYKEIIYNRLDPHVRNEIEQAEAKLVSILDPLLEKQDKLASAIIGYDQEFEYLCITLKVAVLDSHIITRQYVSHEYVQDVDSTLLIEMIKDNINEANNHPPPNPRPGQ